MHYYFAFINYCLVSLQGFFCFLFFGFFFFWSFGVQYSEKFGQMDMEQQTGTK